MEHQYEVARSEGWHQERKYLNNSHIEKERVIDASLRAEDWKALATANCVPLKTAYGWLRKYDEEDTELKTRGGARYSKVTEEHKEKRLKYIEENPLITLQSIKDNIRRDMGIDLSTTIIHRHLDSQFYTVKKIFPQPGSMNSNENKEKRSQYVSTIMSFVGQEKKIIYIDETNCNLFFASLIREVKERIPLLCDRANFKRTKCSRDCDLRGSPNRNGVLGATERILQEGKLLGMASISATASERPNG